MEIVGRVVAYVLSVGVIGGIIFAAIAFGARAKAGKAAGWVAARGEVTRAARPTAWGTLGGGLRYRYRFGGRAYEGGRVRLIDWPGRLWPDAAAVQARLAGARDVEVKVNPALPEDAALDLTPPPAAFGWAGLGVTLVCLLLLGLRRLL
ncbi:DUF3592 domain-containing protein [Aquabacter spiritensis]|uniref:Uncharacterized protein DUF3592 n=1 Tax=Aquabacter spiritensis TaxID=933073 RepID=A0A4R3M213_9HYPH|nr:DUF3592 domain-containing protein [Aquabacter spiritensis]TCT06726.1 uncharacterized protein DUF3592 [Aquabacter spiritensis]